MNTSYEIGLQLRRLAVAGALGIVAAQAAGAADGGAITQADCNMQRLGATIAPAQIGEPVAGVALDEPVWNAATDAAGAHCRVSGKFLPVEQGPNARPIVFGVALPAVWSGRSLHLGGGGMNGTVPRLDQQMKDGLATYGSDSGHTGQDVDWSLSDEAIKNFGYMQLKKTHDVAMILIERAYRAKPRYNYFFGGSQGGREAVTLAQRYPADYDGIIANVPVVNFSSLTFSPALIQIQQKSLTNMIPAAKVKAIQREIISQCDNLDGLNDGIIANYVDCRARFNTTRHAAKQDPWAGKLCPGDRDPNPADASAAACLTRGQISTLNFIFSNYDYQQPLANNLRTFGMWVPTTEFAPLVISAAGPRGGGGGAGRAGGGAGGPGGAGAPGGGRAGGPAAPVAGGPPAPQVRFRGQEGAAPDAPVYGGGQGGLVVTGFVLRDPRSNSLELPTTAEFQQRRVQVSEWLDSATTDLSAFRKRGGKLIAAMGAADTTASTGAQLDWFQGVIDKMGKKNVDSFARFYVLPNAGHGLNGNTFTTDGEGRDVAAREVLNQWDRQWDRVSVLRAWVENGVAPQKLATQRGGEGGLPLCNYPQYPHYRGGGDIALASSYVCKMPKQS